MGSGKQDPTSADCVLEIRQKEQSFLESGPAKANEIALILSKLKLNSKDPSKESVPVILAAIHSLRRIFVHLFHENQISKKSIDKLRQQNELSPENPKKKKQKHDGQKEKTATEKYTQWLEEQYIKYVDKLGEVVSCERKGISVQAPALRTLAECARLEAASAAPPGRGLAHNRALRLALRAALAGGAAAREVLVEEFVAPHADVRYAALWGLARLAAEAKEARAGAAAAGAAAAAAAGEGAPAPAAVLQLLLQIRLPGQDQPFGAWLAPKPTRGDEGEEEGGGGGGAAAAAAASSDEEAPPADEGAGAKKKRRRPGSGGGGGGGAAAAAAGAAAPPATTLAGHRRAFARAALACLKLPMDAPTYRQVLVWLPRHALPHLPDPLALADFLADAYGQGGSVALLALEALFLLMTQHRLQYPKFFGSLYGLCAPATAYARHRQRYYELTGLALGSLAAPAAALAAFLKRALGVALQAPPSGALHALALALAQLQRRPDLLPLLHRPPRPRPPGAGLLLPAHGDAQVKKGTEDKEEDNKPFNPDEKDPEKAHALNSSLWELIALKNHYHPAVAAMAEGFQTKIDPKGLKIDVHDFTNITYKSLFDQEVNRKVKTVPTTFEDINGLLAKKEGNKFEIVGDLFEL